MLRRWLAGQPESLSLLGYQVSGRIQFLVIIFTWFAILTGIWRIRGGLKKKKIMEFSIKGPDPPTPPLHGKKTWSNNALNHPK